MVYTYKRVKKLSHELVTRSMHSVAIGFNPQTHENDVVDSYGLRSLIDEAYLLLAAHLQSPVSRATSDQRPATLILFRPSLNDPNIRFKEVRTFISDSNSTSPFIYPTSIFSPFFFPFIYCRAYAFPLPRKKNFILVSLFPLSNFQTFSNISLLFRLS